MTNNIWRHAHYHATSTTINGVLLPLINIQCHQEQLQEPEFEFCLFGWFTICSCIIFLHPCQIDAPLFGGAHTMKIISLYSKKTMQALAVCDIDRNVSSWNTYTYIQLMNKFEQNRLGCGKQVLICK